MVCCEWYVSGAWCVVNGVCLMVCVVCGDCCLASGVLYVVYGVC